MHATAGGESDATVVQWCSGAVVWLQWCRGGTYGSCACHPRIIERSEPIINTHKPANSPAPKKLKSIFDCSVKTVNPINANPVHSVANKIARPAPVSYT